MDWKLGIRELLPIFLCVILLFMACMLRYVGLEHHDVNTYFQKVSQKNIHTGTHMPMCKQNKYDKMLTAVRSGYSVFG